MTTRPKWTEPTLFAPDEIPYDTLHVRLDFHLDGPRGTIEVWQTITDGQGGWLLCSGGVRVSLQEPKLEGAHAALDAVMVEALRRLNPF